MKKYLFYVATALALGACSSEEYLGEVTQPKTDNQEPQAITFGGLKANLTRADHTGADAAALLGNNFVVEGVMGDGTTQTEAFDHYNVNYAANTANTTESNTANWEYVGQTTHVNSSASIQTIKYWNYGTTQYDFVAFSYGTADKANVTLTEILTANLGKAVNATGNAVYTVTGSAEELAKCYIADLVTLYNRDGVSEYETTVTPKFRSLGTKIRLAFYETVPGYSVTNVKFYSEAWDGTTATSTAGSATPTLFATNAIFPATGSEGTMSVYFPTVGWANSGKDGNAAKADYNQAHIKFEQAADKELGKTKTFGALTNLADKEGSEAAGAKYLGRTSATATYAGDYQIVLPLGTSDNLQLRIEYDLVPIDGGAGTIHVRDARAVVPAQYADWKPNYAYTYIFKISDKTNGWTGVKPNPDYNPEDPDSPKYIPEEGLTPITFDAVVVDTENGLQETVTTVSTPSITTYQEGVNVTASNEYLPGDIYAVVMNGTTVVDVTSLSAPAGVTVYEATTTGAVISESIVQDMLNHVKSDTGITLTKLTVSQTVSSVPAVDGNTLPVSAVKFTGEPGKTYVFEYNDGTKSYVKVIKVATSAEAAASYDWSKADNPYNYNATSIVPEGNVVTFKYAATGFSSVLLLSDIARYLGALYYNGKASVIVWNNGSNDQTYTWDPSAAGNLKGSNWVESTSKTTLVRDITAWFNTSGVNATSVTMKVNGTDVTLKYVTE